MKRRLILVLALASVAVFAAPSALADPGISASATVNSDRSVSVNWNVSAGSFGGVFCTSTSSQTDFTGELTCPIPTLSFNLLQPGWMNYRTLPLDMTITKPTTIYAQVQLIDPFDNGSCSQGDFGADCDSQVIPLTVQPICSQVLVTPATTKQVLVTAAYTTKKLVKKDHWLKSHGHFVKRHGHRVWVEAVYRTIHHPAAYETVTVSAVYQSQCH
jgi:hypothetical protein